jgi:hypothetical protein
VASGPVCPDEANADEADDVSEARLTGAIEALVGLVRAPDAERRLARDRGAFLAELGFSGDDIASLAGASDARLLLYRKLIRRGLGRAVRAEIPRAAARFEGAFDAWVARFIDEEAPRSHYLRDVAFEFVAWAAPRWAADPSVPGYLEDLARHELSAFDVANADAHGRGATAAAGLGQDLAAAPEDLVLPIELDWGVRFHPSVRLCRYAHAVHRLDADEAARDAPARTPTALLAYRDEEHEVRYLELTALAAAMVERLLRGETLREAVVGASSALGHALDGVVLSGTAALLEDLTGRGAVRGGAGG